MIDIGTYEKLVIWGTGLDAVKCIYYLRSKKIKVEYCINTESSIQEFWGIKVYNYDANLLKDAYVIICANEQNYSSISKQLRTIGLQEFKNYIYYEWIYKDLVLLHGNCHMAVIKNMLISVPEFKNKYSFYPNPAICEMNPKEISFNVLNNINIWIHEDIKQDNTYGYKVSDEYIRNEIKKEIKEIIIPNLFGMGGIYFPQSIINKNNPAIKNNKDLNGMFPYADIIIDKCISKSMNLDEIVRCCNLDDILTEKEILENYEKYMEKIKMREGKWDVKIFDFIEQNYQKKKLFYDIGHPTNVVMSKICEGILDILSIITDGGTLESELKMDDHEIPIYSCVRKAMHLDFEDNEIRNGKTAKKMTDEMTFNDYIKQYILWCYQKQNI